MEPTPPPVIAPQPVSESQPKPAWGPVSAVVVTAITYVTSQYLALLLLLIYPLSMQWGEERTISWLEGSPLAQFITMGLMYLLMLWFIWLFLQHRKTSFRALGWNRKPQWLDVAYTLAGFFVYFIALNFVLFPLIKQFVPAIDFEQPQNIGFENTRGPILILVYIALAILPPIAEETMVRGFLYTGLKSKLSHPAAIIATSGLFAFAHLQLGSGSPPLWTAAIDTFALSVVLIYLRDRTGSLYAPVGVHFIKNSLAFLALFIFHIV